MTVRVYLPTTLSDLAGVVAAGRVDAPFLAHAVTETVRAEWVDSSEEEWEYEALCLAADDCRERWTGDDVRRRVVLALDATAAEPVDDPGHPDDPTLVSVAEAVPWSRVAAVHADLDEADAEAGDDLCWFGVQEVEQLLGGLGGARGK